MAFATVEEVRDQTTFGEVSALSDAKLQGYIERANAYLRRTSGDYRTATDEDLLTDLKRVTILLVEYIWFLDQPEVKESNMSGLQSERIGSYSYTKGTKTGLTGNEELDSLLESLKVSHGVNLFSINGPSRGNNVSLTNPHAYVNGYWRTENEN